MSINITDGFNINFAAPVDYRMVTANSTTRLAIAYKYDGLRVFQLDNRVSYIWNSGGSGNWDVENSDKISGSGTTNYIPKFTSTGQIGTSSIYVNGNNVGIGTNNPKEYLQIGSFPVAYLGQSLPLVFHKGGITAIGYNWYFEDGLDKFFDDSLGSSVIIFDNDLIEFVHKEAYGSFVTSLSLTALGRASVNNILVGLGSVTSPSISFIDDINTGIYSTSANKIGISSDGVNQITISPYDLYANIHNKGTNGIGDSGNTTFAPDGLGGGTGAWLNPSIASGTFSSVIVTGSGSPSANLSGVFLAGPVSWMRVGNVVSVSGVVNFNVSSASAATFWISLPIKPYFGNTGYFSLSGVGKTIGKTSGGDVASIYGEIDLNRSVAKFEFTPSTTYPQQMCFNFQYVVYSGILVDLC